MEDRVAESLGSPAEIAKTAALEFRRRRTLLSRSWLAAVALFVFTNVLSLCVGYAIKRPATLGDESPVITKYYPVEDLVTPWRGLGRDAAPDFESLVDEIKSVVKPESWGDNKKLVPMRENLLLAVTNSAEAHSEIQDLLSIHREAINNEQWFVQQNICKYCRATPMPSGGAPCANCGAMRCVPRFETPSLAVLP